LQACPCALVRVVVHGSGFNRLFAFLNGNFSKPLRAGKVRAEERTFTRCKAMIYTNAPQVRNLTAQQVLRSSQTVKL
jgi:hypothetical protein